MAKTRDGFYKLTASSVGSDLYVLLGGGGQKSLSDFALSSSLNDYVTSSTLNSSLSDFLLVGGTTPRGLSASGTWDISITGNANYADDADTVDGYHVDSLESYYCTVIDATGLNVDTWYPVTMEIGNSVQTRIRVEGQTDAPGSWNTRTDKKMAVTLDYTVQGSKYGWTLPERTIFRFTLGAGTGTSNCIAGLGQLTNSSTEYVFVRGGAKYNFYVSRFITPILRTSTYTISSQSVSPTTTSPTVISRNNALKSDLTWSNISGKPTIPTVTNYYWADLKIGSSSSTSMTPTFGSSVRLNSSIDGAGGAVSLELFRGTNASWKLINSGGNLHFQCNWTTAVTDYYNVVLLDYNTKYTNLHGKLIIHNGGMQVTGNAILNNNLDISGNTISKSGLGKDNYIAYPGGGVKEFSSNQTGYLKITLPQSWSNTMIKFDVNIFNYVSGTSAIYTICGYNYSDNNQWFHPTVYSQRYLITDTSKGNLTVRFGHDGTKCAIYIGESTTSWALPIISVSNITYGFSSNDTFDKWGSGWNISFTTSLGTISQTVTNPASNYISYTTLNVSVLGKSSGNCPLVFTSSINASTTTSSYKQIYTDTVNDIYYNPSTNRLTTPLLSVGYSNTSYVLSTSSFICNSWVRTTNLTGWYNETYGGGIYMQDSDYVKIYNSKKFKVTNTEYNSISTSGGIEAINATLRQTSDSSYDTPTLYVEGVTEHIGGTVNLITSISPTSASQTYTLDATYGSIIHLSNRYQVYIKLPESSPNGTTFLVSKFDTGQALISTSNNSQIYTVYNGSSGRTTSSSITKPCFFIIYKYSNTWFINYFGNVSGN